MFGCLLGINDTPSTGAAIGAPSSVLAAFDTPFEPDAHHPLGLPVYEMRLHVHRLVATAMDPLVPTKELKEPITVTPDQIIWASPGIVEGC